jgi:hypothetical protein
MIVVGKGEALQGHSRHLADRQQRSTMAAHVCFCIAPAFDQLNMEASRQALLKALLGSSDNQSLDVVGRL